MEEEPGLCVDGFSGPGLQTAHITSYISLSRAQSHIHHLTAREAKKTVVEVMCPEEENTDIGEQQHTLPQS